MITDLDVYADAVTVRVVVAAGVDLQRALEAVLSAAATAAAADSAAVVACVQQALTYVEPHAPLIAVTVTPSESAWVLIAWLVQIFEAESPSRVLAALFVAGLCLGLQRRRLAA